MARKQAGISNSYEASCYVSIQAKGTTKARHFYKNLNQLIIANQYLLLHFLYFSPPSSGLRLPIYQSMNQNTQGLPVKFQEGEELAYNITPRPTSNFHILPLCNISKTISWFFGRALKRQHIRWIDIIQDREQPAYPAVVARKPLPVTRDVVSWISKHRASVRHHRTCAALRYLWMMLDIYLTGRKHKLSIEDWTNRKE